ncbi:hypothetical protein TVAG_453640 [Trichomonas vaginalis G3]|uniref:Secretory carrier membrane protein n=1 Tax=Trichomonas vaginalis (strain ATCC PRA-98 / G3) TaxID=412133 RepID=A2DPU0_TRIV3|nr:protein transport [Trichomonas vaginalis G3]EAY17536.1 hypothetical protein TVAG_453640 [Trichomonas vaginalis G3]KAI5520580.1 protein transport [Trichomonas vaginalis G3]|eukprot:XP_001329671.1 hypothetical protein [Trichomonas vaginalis G3]
MSTDTSYLDNYSPFNDADLMDELPEIKKTQPSAAPAKHDDEITQEMLDQMEQRLNIMEEDLKNQEQRTGPLGGFLHEPEPNWPKFYPLVHFDINEVDASYRSYVNETFFSWVCMLVTYFLNFIASLTLLSAGDAVNSPGTKISLSALYFFFICPIALDLDALSVYRALKTAPSTLAFTKIFICLALTLIFEFVLAVGAQSSGSVGLITTIDLFASKCVGTGIFGIIVTICFAVTIFFTTKLLIRLWKFFRGTEQGGHMDQDLKLTVAQFVVDTLKNNDNQA